MKRPLSILLALVLTFTLLPVTALAEETLTLEVTVRDFKEDGILFESPVPYEKITGMVADTLGPDRKPVYNLQVWKDKYGEEVTQEMLTGLFNDTPGYNLSTPKTLALEPVGDNWEIRSSSMFPIDDELFGNEGNSHNYHFSIEIHSRFKYVEGAEFYFNGDDDIWVFMNDKLVIDLGGVSYSTSQTVNLDEVAADLGIAVGDIVSFDMFYMERHLTGSNMNMRTNFEFLNLDASTWALPELERADELGLIPDSLRGADLTAPITRAEFAAVAVKVYEALANGEALPAVSNPFVDTSDLEVLKAYNTGITAGISDSEFAPDALLNREQCATMLTRVFKRVTLPGWTLQTDAQFTLPFDQPAPFADDADIS
ncbi:MAG: fibro-slime domain-containing protein, partial [Clostridia bacterium]|nr:fibro-slime domain-containing protein [Clostridia bacterium]